MASVIEILIEYLKSNNFDGLIYPEIECGCSLDDLHPCDDNFSDCRPAYKNPDRTDENDWLMVESKK